MSKKNVLVIQPDKMFADDLKFFVGERGHECTVYCTAEEVIKNFNKLGDFNIIIIEAVMPFSPPYSEKEKALQGGEILFSRIKEKYLNVKFIIISTFGFNELHINFPAEPSVKLTVLHPLVDTTIDKILDTIDSP